MKIQNQCSYYNGSMLRQLIVGFVVFGKDGKRKAFTISVYYKKHEKKFGWYCYLPLKYTVTCV